MAKGMNAFGEAVEHLQDHFPEDAPDKDWLEYIGKNDFFLITRDDAIRKNPAEKKAFQDNSVGAFFLGGKKTTGWELIEQLVRNWKRIKEFAERTRRPFAFRIPPKGTKFDKIDF